MRLTDHLREYTEIVPTEVVTTIWQGNQAEMEEDVPRTVALQIRVEVDNLPAACLPVFTPEDIRDAQNGDENICEVVKLKKSGWNPKDKDLSSISIETWQLIHDWKRLNLKRGYCTDSLGPINNWFFWKHWHSWCWNISMMTRDTSELIKLSCCLTTL